MAETNVAVTDFNLEHWMKDLPEPLKNIPLIYLAIPGSHDSMTYGIRRSNGLAPDAEPILRNLYPLFRGTILRWTVTQSADAMQQLLMGIRYLDLRLATKHGTDDLYFTHGLYADEITKPLEQVKEFVETHPEEVVIMDFQHFYDFTPEDHRNLMRILLNTFGRKLCPRRSDLQRVNLNSMNRLGQQVIIVYRHMSVYSTNDFWPPQTMPSPWPRQEKASELIKYFENLRRQSGTGFVHQAVLTPSPGFLVLRWLSNLREKCAIPVMKTVFPKLADFSPGSPQGMAAEASKATVNVIIADFVEMNNSIFAKTVIDLNLKLLRNTDIVYHG